MWIINPNHREDRSIHARTKRSWWCPTRCGGGLGELAEPNCARYLPLLLRIVRATVPLAHNRCAYATRHPMSSFPLPLLTLTRMLHAPHWFLQKAIVIIFDHGFDVGVLLEVGCSSNGIGGRRLSTMTVPEMKPMSSATAAGYVRSSWKESKAEFTPIAVVFGLVVVALSIGAHTAKQQLVHSPSVWVSKKKRESIPEVEMPDQVAGEAGHFVDKSFLRKVAHIQDLDAARSGTSDPFYTPRVTESLKSVGVNPRGH